MLPAKPRPAASVIVCADGDAGLKVLMGVRSGQGAFAGHLVFPGGTLKEEDCSVAAREVVVGVAEGEADELLGTAGTGLPHFAAALRECYEEAGLLLVSPRDGIELTWEVRATPAGRRASDFYRMLKDAGLVLRADALAYFSHWITPPFVNKRFDTRFFVTCVPRQLDLEPDGREILELVWVSPAEAQEGARGGRFSLAFPTLKHLERLSAYRTTKELWDSAVRNSARVRAVTPRLGPQGLEVDD